MQKNMTVSISLLTQRLCPLTICFCKLNSFNSNLLAMHSLAAASWPRISETEPKWFLFETSCYAFGGRIRGFANLNVNKVNIFDCNIFILTA